MNIHENPYTKHLTANYHLTLRRLRAERGLTQKQVADGVGISTTMIQRYEMSPDKEYSSRPSAGTAMKIEAFFSKTPRLNESLETGYPDESYAPDDAHSLPVPMAAWEKSSLKEFSLDELLAEVKSRGYQVTLSSLNT